MTEHLDVFPRSIRGGGNVLPTKTARDFIKNNCRLALSTVTVHDVSMTAFQITPAEEHSASEILNIIPASTFIKNLAFGSNKITYDSVAKSSMSTVSDLNGIVYNIRYTNNAILFDTFSSSGASLTDSDLDKLEQALTSISYDSSSYEIRYDVVGEIDV